MTEMNTSSGSEIMQQRCESHDDMQKNELNRYCISCDAPICRHCIRSGEHYNHSILIIYRLVYPNVVPLSETKEYIDCDKIQPYKCNKKWVVSLTPLPHNGSGSLIEGNGACYHCKRKLPDPGRFRFCSIACKPYKCNKKWVVSLTPLSHNGSGSLIEGDGACCLCKRKLTNPDPFRFCSIACKVQADVGEGWVELYVKPEVVQKPNRKRGRKGVPHRAPFL